LKRKKVNILFLDSRHVENGPILEFYQHDESNRQPGRSNPESLNTGVCV